MLTFHTWALLIYFAAQVVEDLNKRMNSLARVFYCLVLENH